MLALVILGGYGLLAYLVLPGFWTHYEHQRGLADMPMVTRTAQGIPGDPMNVGLIGDIGDVVCAMHAAGWYPADRITLKSSIEIVGSVLLDRPYKDAPVSNLYYLGRREDLDLRRWDVVPLRERPLRRPAPQPPLGAALRSSEPGEDLALALAQPAIALGHLGEVPGQPPELGHVQTILRILSP